MRAIDFCGSGNGFARNDAISQSAVWKVRYIDAVVGAWDQLTLGA